MVGGVLVVDDSPETRALTAEMLAPEGIVATMATTGDEALAKFPIVRPECILLDVNLPGMDGVTVCERIRALPGGDAVAIVFITARRDVDTFDRALRAGGDDFLTKPFRPSELVIRIQTARRLRRMASAHDALSLDLKRQRDELQRLQLQREQLTQFLVHDLKTPVHSISLLSSRILGLVASEPRAHESTLRIREEARSLLRMITNLLDVTKSSEERLVANRQRVDVRDLVKSAVGDLEARASSAELEIVTDIAVTHAELDRDLIHRLLANLLDNAIRHAPEHTKVTIAARRTDAGIELRVADAGPGVPPELQTILFERFAAAGPRGSHGLGLAFCRVAAVAHGGRIWVEDGSRGAVFCVEIPDAR